MTQVYLVILLFVGRNKEERNERESNSQKTQVTEVTGFFKTGFFKSFNDITEPDGSISQDTQSVKCNTTCQICWDLCEQIVSHQLDMEMVLDI